MDLSLDKPIIKNAQLGRRICRCFITDKRTPVQENTIIELVLKLRADRLVIIILSDILPSIYQHQGKCTFL